ncbi:glucomannan 4-beta-mannosyltransferase 9-like protein [Tanacetum coccineum]
MERGFLSQKGSGGGRGVKEKSLNTNSINTSRGMGVSTESGDTMNEDAPVGGAPAVKEGVTPFVVALMMEKDKLSSVEDTTISESFPPLSTPVTTAANAPGMSSYAYITGKPSGKKVNVQTLFTPGGNGIDVKVAYPVVDNYDRNTWGKYGLVRSMFSSSMGLFSFQFSSIDGLDDMLENGPWFIQNHSLILKKWHPDENLLKEDVSTVLVWVKLYGVPVTAFSEDGLSVIANKLGRLSYAIVMIELQADVELKDNIVVAMPKITREGHYTCAGEKKTVKKPSQTSRVVIRRKVWNLLLRHIDNDGEFASNTPIGEKIDKIERQIYKGKIRLLDNDGNPLVPTDIVESDSEVEVVFDETANLRILTSGKDGSDKGYGTNSLLEQWRDSYPDNDDYDPYNDDMYENHDLSEHLQSICDNLDITVYGRKKK